MLCVPIRHAILVALFTQFAAAQQVATDVRIPSDVAQFQGLRIDGPANGAGARNVQIFLLTEDLHVLHVLPGFWHPIDFERALRFALALNRLWGGDSRTLIQKKNMFYRMHRAELCQQSAQMHARILYWPFAKYDDFDVAEYAGLGRRYYDLNRRIDGRGRSFPRAGQTAPVVSREFHRLDQRRRAADRKANLKKTATRKKQDREKRRRK